jgi:8-oxo-dGTP diphosphatase
MAHFAIQFGKQAIGKLYSEKPSVYGICTGEHNKIAILRTGKKENYCFDLPGGTLSNDESEPEALIREFIDEVGLDVWPIRQLGRAGQFCNLEDKYVNNLSAFYEVEITGDMAHPTDEEHKLVWFSIDEALRRLRFDSHSWALLAWERERFRADRF